MSALTKYLKEIVVSGSEIQISPELEAFIINNSSKDGSLKSVAIKAPKDIDNIFVFTFDLRNKSATELITTNLLTPNWINRKCDGIVYYYKDDTHYFILCEIKTTYSKGAKNQFKSMEAFLGYVIKTIEVNFQERIDLKKIKIIKILYINRRTPKSFVHKTNSTPFNPQIEANEITCDIDSTQQFPISQLLCGAQNNF